MKKILILFLLTGCITFSQNTATSANTWYKINSKGRFVTKIKAWGYYSEHEVVVHLINQHWATSEVEYISEFNYNHYRIKLEWGFVGDNANRFMAVKVVPVGTGAATGFEFTDVSNPSFDYGLQIVDNSLVTPISPKGLLFVDEWTGNVGIGTLTPTEKLQIDGNIKLSSSIYWDWSGRRIEQFSSDGQSQMIRFTNSMDTNNGNSDGGFNFTDNNGASVLRINNYTVGIGTTDTKGFKLGVQGKIAAEEVKVAMYSNWADFVFETNYNLPSLQEVEIHIKENGHLKDIPSAKEVSENGIFLGDMNAKLLQKIEELTLYTIEQEKKLESQKTQLKTQLEINKELQNRLLRIEKLLLSNNQ